MFADQVFDLRLGLIIEGVIGRAHVGEFGVAAFWIDEARRQQRKFRWNGTERTIGMPKAVAKIEQMGAMISRQRLAVFSEIGDIVQPGGEPVILLLSDVAAPGVLAFAEIQRKGHLL